MAKIKIAIVGMGNCASSLVQGIEYYKHEKPEDTSGLMHWDVGGYLASDIEVVAAFDIEGEPSPGSGPASRHAGKGSSVSARSAEHAANPTRKGAFMRIAKATGRQALCFAPSRAAPLRAARGGLQMAGCAQIANFVAVISATMVSR